MWTLDFPWVPLALLGLSLGVIGSITGAGGGFLLVPVLLALYPTASVKTITAISLAVVLASGVSGTLAFARLRRIDWRAGSIFAAAGVPGAAIGALLTSFVPRELFSVLFGLFLVTMAFQLMFRSRPVQRGQPPARPNLWKGAIISFFIGIFSTVLGIGGGPLQVPMMTQVLGYPVLIATATSQFSLTFKSFAATATHILTGEFNEGVRRTLALAAGVLIGAQIGARLSGIVPDRWILRLLAAGLLLVGANLMISAFLAWQTRVID